MSEAPPPQEKQPELSRPTGMIRLGEPAFWLGLLGAVFGAVAGYFLFRLAARHGFVVLALPGAFVGIGRMALARRKSLVLAVICGILAAAVEVYTIEQLLVGGIRSASPFLLVVSAIGVIIAVSFGLGRNPNEWDR